MSSARPCFVAPSMGTVATFLPRRSTVTRSATASTSSSLCVMTMMAVPPAFSSRSTLNSSCASCGVSTAVGSSRISTLASRYSALRISTRCSWPTERFSTRACGATASPYLRDSSRTRSSAAGMSIATPLRGSAARTMFSATVITGISMKCWCTMPICASMASDGDVKRTARPSSRISPASGRYSPYRQFISVDLPAPFSPSSAWISPARTSRSTASLATTPGKILVTPRSSSTGVLELRGSEPAGGFASSATGPRSGSRPTRP